MSFFAARPRASHLRQWHLEMRAAIHDRELKVLDLIAQHLPVPNAVLGMTEEEVTVYFEDARRELDAAACFRVIFTAVAACSSSRATSRRGQDLRRRAPRRDHAPRGRSRRATTGSESCRDK